MAICQRQSGLSCGSCCCACRDCGRDPDPAPGAAALAAGATALSGVAMAGWQAGELTSDVDKLGRAVSCGAALLRGREKEEQWLVDWLVGWLVGRLERMAWSTTALARLAHCVLLTPAAPLPQPTCAHGRASTTHGRADKQAARCACLLFHPCVRREYRYRYCVNCMYVCKYRSVQSTDQYRVQYSTLSALAGWALPPFTW